MTKAKQEKIERAWKVLISSGVVAPDDIQALERRRRDRALLALASETLVKGKENGVISVTLVTDMTLYVAEDGQPPRIAPRVTTPTTRRTRDKANEAKTNANEANTGSDAGEIPTEFLKAACEELNIKWFGRKAALKSKRVIARARELAAGG